MKTKQHTTYWVIGVKTSGSDIDTCVRLSALACNPDTIAEMVRENTLDGMLADTANAKMSLASLTRDNGEIQAEFRVVIPFLIEYAQGSLEAANDLATEALQCLGKQIKKLSHCATKGGLAEIVSIEVRGIDPSITDSVDPSIAESLEAELFEDNGAALTRDMIGRARAREFFRTTLAAALDEQTGSDESDVMAFADQLIQMLAADIAGCLNLNGFGPIPAAGVLEIIAETISAEEEAK